MSELQGLKYLWRTAPRAPMELFESVSGQHPALVQVMFGRGLASASACADFLAGLNPESDDPLLLADLGRARDRLMMARDRGETIAVFTDYDADGVNAAAVLATGLRMLEIEPLVRLPNRFTDGYGLTPSIVEELADRGAGVIVTADCGSTAHEAALRARDRGVDLIITDHHQCPPHLPEAYALVNPWRPDCPYPCDFLCGAGVAFKLLQALADALLPGGRASMEPLLDLVAVATVADIMPLVGENRRLVLAGLNIMNAFPRPGVHALIQTAALEPGQVDASALGFRIAPRVNAAGRLDDPELAFRLLMASTYEEAFELAEQINAMNLERQNRTRELQAEARDLIEGRVEGGAYSLVVGAEDWPQGIVGLVAGRLAQDFNRPSLVYRISEGTATGSGRGIKGFNLLEALDACSDVFTRYGGHQAAAGFTLPAARLHELAERFEAKVRELLTPEQLQPVLSVDCYLKPATVSFDFARALESLAPFGAGFPQPTFGMKDLTVTEIRPLGASGDHWRLRLRPQQGGYPLECVIWGNPDAASRTPIGTRVHIAFQMRRELYEGNWKLQLEVQDLALAA